ncbi:hypothetical protein BGP_5882 [Beggiatoa sp. PS]|nr:hypothetical protein BGP_5882 [Beggiatoa sp. PS]
MEVCDGSDCDTQSFTVIVGSPDEQPADEEPLSTDDSSDNCFIELPRYLCLNYRAEYSSGGNTESTPTGNQISQTITIFRLRVARRLNIRLSSITQLNLMGQVITIWV